MEQTEFLNTVTVGEKQYNIGHFQSGIGSWILKRLMRTFRDFMKSIEGVEGDETAALNTDPVEFAHNLIQQLLMELDEKEYSTIQRHALNVVSFTDSVAGREFEQSIILKSGTFAIKELATDIGTVDYLTSQALFANLSPFFSQTGLKAAMTGEQVSSR